jgi:hypothetical protein
MESKENLPHICADEPQLLFSPRPPRPSALLSIKLFAKLFAVYDDFSSASQP